MIYGSDALMHIGPKLLSPFDKDLVNPASIDIRIGNMVMDERGHKFSIAETSEASRFYVDPGEFLLVETLEEIRVPHDCALDLRLKSSRAREGWNHTLAFWFDPGWVGKGTMEIMNITKERKLGIYFGQRFAQVIIHELVGARLVYAGRYQGAETVEGMKPGN